MTNNVFAQHCADQQVLNNVVEEVVGYLNDLSANSEISWATIVTILPRSLCNCVNDKGFDVELNKVIPHVAELHDHAKYILTKLRGRYINPIQMNVIPGWLKPNPYYVEIVKTPGYNLYENDDGYKSMLMTNDLAHRIEHYDMVCKTGLYINDKLGLDIEPNKIDAVAYLHDLFAVYRENHHELSYSHVMQNFDVLNKHIPNILDWESVALACKEHRASMKGKFSSTFTELMNSADRELPGNICNMIHRSANFGRNHKNQPVDMDRVINHICDKFGSKGYAKYPSLYKAAFGSDLTMQQSAVDCIATLTNKEYLSELGLTDKGELSYKGNIYQNPNYVKLLIESTELQFKHLTKD